MPLVNEHVMLTGLRAESALNGLHGNVVSYDTSTGRYSVDVLVESGEIVDRVAVKPSNLELPFASVD